MSAPPLGDDHRNAPNAPIKSCCRKPASVIHTGHQARQHRGVSDLVTTGQAAKELGISARSLARWAHEGAVTPDLVTPGGHFRWDVERLREQLRGQRQRDE